MTNIPFDANKNRFTYEMAEGHRIRTGHKLTGFYREVEDGIYRLIRTCDCNKGGE